MNLSEIGLKALDVGKEVILKYAREGFEVEWKADQTPVTIADKTAEEKMRSFLASEMKCGFVGEEHGVENLDSEYVWVLDPIDGTKSFARGVPLYGTLLACLKDGVPVWGAIDISAQNQRVWAEKGRGIFLNGQKTQVSQEKDMAKSCLVTGTVSTFESFGLEGAFHKLRKEFNLYRGWGDCYGYFLVLNGRAEVMTDPVVSLWDIAPLPVLFEEAGGKFTDLAGRNFAEMVPDISKWQMKADTFNALGSNGKFHENCLAFFP